MSSRARVEQQPQAQGMALLVGVGLAIVFLLFIAFLNVVKSGTLVSESNLLYVSLIFYAGAAALYMGFGITGVERYVRAASLSTAAGLIANTGAAAHRWYTAGHPPFASIYEMLLSFIWMVALLTLIAERKYGVKVIGTITMPLAATGVMLMQLLPSDVRPLVPALQSSWLHVHVTLAMLAYAACALSFALALTFLVKDQMRTETFMAWTSAMVTAIYAGVLFTRFERWGGLSVIAWDPQKHEEVFLQRGVRLFITIPDLGWLFLLVTLAVAAPLGFFAYARLRGREVNLLNTNRAVFLGIVLQVIMLAAFAWRVKGGAYSSLDAEGSFATSLAASPFILAGMLSGIFASLLYLMLDWRRADLERLLPDASRIDSLTYKTIGLAFPLLTLMIAAGAYWANRTWGSYWSWDPKETWAAITWLVYAGYLHMRITRGWRGRRAAYFAILGFAVVMFTFFGVTYLLPGLHAYA
jgi:ABC-type transport system involved in cytochrome c biogenesis permease subunit